MRKRGTLFLGGSKKRETKFGTIKHKDSAKEGTRNSRRGGRRKS